MVRVGTQDLWLLVLVSAAITGSLKASVILIYLLWPSKCFNHYPSAPWHTDSDIQMFYLQKRKLCELQHSDIILLMFFFSGDLTLFFCVYRLRMQFWWRKLFLSGSSTSSVSHEPPQRTVAPMSALLQTNAVRSESKRWLWRSLVSHPQETFPRYHQWVSSRAVIMWITT